MALRNRELHARNDDDDAIIIALTLSYTPGHLLYKNAANLLSLPDLQSSQSAQENLERLLFAYIPTCMIEKLAVHIDIVLVDVLQCYVAYCYNGAQW